MIIVWGERMCGKVDQVEDLVHVATKFFHVQYVPLIPLQSFIVISNTQSHGEFNGLAIPMSIKSVLSTYLRTALLIGCALFMFRAFTMFNSVESSSVLAMVNLMVGGFLGISFWASFQLMRADEVRAKELFQELRSVGIYL